jgi:glycosyltransferase involved in cell wall biosynthesis
MRTRKTQLKFLFIGVDWNRKGGPSAIELVEKLNNLGIAAHLTIVGCKVPDEVKLSKCISHISFIAKSEKQGIDRLTKLYEEAHFFILPTKADCTPVVFSEAMSFGLPVITTDVGGCSSIVINGVSGFCFKESMFIEESLRSITMVNQDKSKYEALALNSFTFYSDNLSWSINGRKIIESLNELLSNS